MSERDVPYAIALAIGYVCAFGAPAITRKATVALASFMAVSWSVWLWSWAETPPQVWLRAHGFPTEAYWLWIVADASVGLAAICVGIIGASGQGSDGWHGWVAWGISSAMLGAHTSKWESHTLSADSYYAMLDALFLAWIATLILAGGRGIASFLGSCCRDGLWRLGYSGSKPGQACPRVVGKS